MEYTVEVVRWDMKSQETRWVRLTYQRTHLRDDLWRDFLLRTEVLGRIVENLHPRKTELH